MSYVSISEPVMARIVQAAKDTKTEIIGLLLGRLEEDTIVIEDSTTHEFTSERYRVRLPPSSIAYIADQLVSGRLKGNIVGWYHSHTEGGLFFSETDVATQLQLQQFSALIVGIVVDATNGDVGCFRVATGTNEPIRLPQSNVRTFKDQAEAVQTHSPPPAAVAPTPTLEVRQRSRSSKGVSRRLALVLIVIVLAVSAGAFAALLYSYKPKPTETPVTITPAPISAATVGTPIWVEANVTGTGHNITLVYAEANAGSPTQASMTATGSEYSYIIPGSQVTGNMTYYIKAYDTTGKLVNTTTYYIAVGDFALQLHSNALTVYRTESSAVDLQVEPINNFNGQLELSSTGAPTGLVAEFSSNHPPSGTLVHLNFTALENTPNGTFPVTVVATYTTSQSSQVVRTAVIEVTVADFQFNVTPTTVAAQRGSTASFTITLTLQKGFVSPVNITDVSGLPEGATYTVSVGNPSVLAGSPRTTEITLKIKIPISAKAGTYSIGIVAVGGGISHLQMTQLTVR